ncbi:P-loop containing nucleoside triphosphate hydrolase protein [Hypomontagnella monticulosa]|nr:P-loop containing nucleoside triphosphate hydrolase protein [Hypomontagnella monticulosa]
MKAQGDKSNALDRLMALVGLENVKIQFLKIKATIDAAQRREGWLRHQDLNIAFLGNPGTGKTTVAEIYRDFLVESKVWTDLYRPPTIKKPGFSFQYREDVRRFYEANGRSKGILIFDDIDRSNAQIQEYLGHILGGFPENLIIVVTGSVIGVSKILGSRPNSRWECWRRPQLQDYDDEQLRAKLLRLIDRNHLQVDGGPESPYPLMAARRVGRGRNTDGFGNMHEIALAFEQTLERQAYRLKQDKLNAPQADGLSIPEPTEDNRQLVLTMEDFMGPEPAEPWAESAAWKELDQMAGLEHVKNTIRSLMRHSKNNYYLELQGKEPKKITLNRMFLGPPGTGKTTVAKLYGQILGELGLLSSKEVIFTTPSDFIGPYTGQTETRTSAIIDSAAGKALIIDDAHTFFTRDETSVLGDDLDSFRRACIDTLVSRIHNRPGEDRSVILIGYADKMEDMFQKCNPGLKRRFPLEEAFRFHDYDDKQLNEILQIKMAKEEITASKKAMDVAAEVLRRARDRPNFGNGGDVDNLLNQAKARFRERKAAEKEKQTTAQGDGSHSATDANGEAVHHDDEEDRIVVALEPQDFDPEWDRGTNLDGSGKASSLFDGLLGFDEIRKQFEGYQLMAANMRRRGKDPRESIPFTYVFKGPPGTGKTHTARIMGKMFYRMGFLSTDEVVECSASHMIGQYTGQTAPKVVSLLDSALGKVLFIDEAYRLTSRLGGGFESEAIGELVDCMTKPRYLRKMIIILAGYNNDMSKLLKSNAGLRGRFPTEIRFRPMDEELSRKHLLKLLSKQDIEIHDETEPSSDDHETVLRLFYKLGMTGGWSNGRDIQTLANVITSEVYKRTPSIPTESESNSGGETATGSARGNEKETDNRADEDASSLDSLRISTRELIKFLKDLFRERIKAGGSGDNSGDRSFGVAQ